MTDPIERIEWRQASMLNANDYNPNVVFSPELRLLELSIIRTGWVQPILINRAAWCASENGQRRSDTSSVLSEGRYLALIEHAPAASYPTERPRYE